jgi:hypothetical protein
MTDVPSALFAADVAPGIPDLFGRLIGSWRVHSRSLDEDTGEWSETDFTWSFARTLDGWGVQDVIVLDDGTVAGTTVRAWDAATEVWRVAWFGVRGRNFSSFTARPDGDDGIVLDGVGEDGRPLRWRFLGIRPDGFTWEGRIESAEGWLLEQRMDAVRRN